jgi:hypothetical protein
MIDPCSQPGAEFLGKVTNFSFGELDHLSEYYYFFTIMKQPSLQERMSRFT